MKKESLEKLSLSELGDPLAKNALELLEFMEKKADGITMRDKKRQVELLQELIRKKRMSNRETCVIKNLSSEFFGPASLGQLTLWQ